MAWLRGWRAAGLGAVLALAGGGALWTLVLTPSASRDVSAAVFVDLNNDGARDDGDIGFPGLTLVLDSGLSAVTDARGVALFGDISRDGRVVALTEESMAIVRDHGVATRGDRTEFTVGKDGWAVIPLVPKGFLALDVRGGSDIGRGVLGVQPSVPPSPAAEHHDPEGARDDGTGCGCGQ